MKIVSFNTNGIRARPHQLGRLKETLAPDILGIQETKVRDEEFPLEMIAELGYHAEFFGQKGHYGVALLSQKAPLEVGKGFPGDEDDAQRRLIWARYEQASGKPLTVINGYFPQGESREHPTKFPAKRKYYKDLLEFLESDFRPSDDLILMGDVNVAHKDEDIGLGEANAKRWLKTGKCAFLPEEREWLEALMAWGLEDTFRAQHPGADVLSWFDYRSRGFDREPKHGLRIDLIMATKGLMARCEDSGIDYAIRGMERPSDHCPIWVQVGG